jgi:hypothetical protein
MTEDFIQLGAVAVLFLIAIREFFTYLKAKKNGNGEGKVMSEAILTELQRMNNNHLHALQETIEEGNREIVKAINDGTIKQIELLGRIEGKLDSRK